MAMDKSPPAALVEEARQWGAENMDWLDPDGTRWTAERAAAFAQRKVEEEESSWRNALLKFAGVEFDGVDAAALLVNVDIDSLKQKYGGTPSMIVGSVAHKAREQGRVEGLKTLASALKKIGIAPHVRALVLAAKETPDA